MSCPVGDFGQKLRVFTKINLPSYTFMLNQLNSGVRALSLSRETERDTERERESGGAAEKELEQYLPVTVSAAGPLPVPIVYLTNKANWS